MNSRTVTSSMIASLMTIVVNDVHAQDSASLDDTGPFLALVANRISADFENRADVDFDDSDTAGGIRGGYMFNDIFGVEIQYLDLGDYKAGETPATRIDLDADALTAAAVFNWSINDKFDAYGKLGAYYIDAESNSMVAGIDFREKEDDVSPFAAVGIEYDLGTWNVFAEFAIADTDAHNLAMDVISLGVKYEFGVQQ